MTTLAVYSPLPFWPDLDGTPLDNGKIYFGVTGQNPVTNPVAVYWDSAKTQPAAQPIKTLHGYIVRNGAPSTIYIDGDYSMSAYNKQSALIITMPSNLLQNAAAAAAAAVEADLALTSGAGLVGHDFSLTYPLHTVGADISKINDARTQFGAVIDGTTDNLTALNTTLVTPRARIFVEETNDLKVSTFPTNPYGPEMGPGRVIMPFSIGAGPGRQQLNSPAESRMNVFGQEYLYFAQNKLNSRVSFKAVFSGDSTTAGNSLVNVAYQIHTMTQQCVRDRGFDMDTIVNAGHSGATTEQWRVSYLAGDLASNPDLYVIRWGINDPGWKKDGTVGTLNAYEAELPLRRDITDFATSLRSALTTIRAAKTVAQMSVILMVPNATGDSQNGRDEKWYEQVVRVCRKAARDFQCCFIDTYSIWRDSRVASGRWMDDSFGDGRAIHPLDLMNQWIAGAIAEALVPTGMMNRHVGSAFVQPPLATTPNAYPVGTSTFRMAWSINGVTVNGQVISHRGADGIVHQTATDWTTQRRPAIRIGDCTSNTWQDWISTPTNPVVLSLSNGWTASGRGITYDKEGGLVHVRGRITGGTTTNGTVIATLPTGFRPVADEFRAVVCGAALDTFASISVDTSGNVKVIVCSSNALLDVGVTFSVY